MAATVAKAWQQVQQKILPSPLPPQPTTLTHSTLNTKVAAKQQNPFNHVDKKLNRKKYYHHIYQANEELARYQNKTV